MKRPNLVPTLAVTAGAALVTAALLGGFVLRGAPSASPAPQGTHLVSSNSPSASQGATVTVTATGNVSGAPDTVTLQLGITANGSTAASALDKANSEMSSLQGVYLSHGVAKSQLQTSGLNLSPSYNNTGQISGYSASEELTVTMHDMAKAGSLIDVGSHAIGNDEQVNGINFSISDTSKLLGEARAQAMRNAQLQAQQIASGAGVKLGAIKSVVDQEQPPSPIYYPYNALAAPSAAKQAAPLQVGKQQLSIQVEVVYYLG